ncbi:MAG: hypothetical protein GXY33_11180 [Phycisphaerae bacterium]|nr:hypothetical protein [Phycisphaerae bacterium]
MAFEGFYPATLATFRHIHDRYGREVLEQYWREMAVEYYGPVIEQFRAGGLDAVAKHFRDYFAREPNADVEVVRKGDRVVVDVRRNPAHHWLKHFGCEIPEWYDDHIGIIGGTMAQKAGMAFECTGGGPSYTMTFIRSGQ